MHSMDPVMATEAHQLHHHLVFQKTVRTDKGYRVDGHSLELNLNGCESWVNAPNDGRDEESQALQRQAGETESKGACVDVGIAEGAEEDLLLGCFDEDLCTDVLATNAALSYDPLFRSKETGGAGSVVDDEESEKT